MDRRPNLPLEKMGTALLTSVNLTEIQDLEIFMLMIIIERWFIPCSNNVLWQQTKLH